MRTRFDFHTQRRQDAKKSENLSSFASWRSVNRRAVHYNSWMAERKSATVWIIAATLILLAPVVAYLAAYFALATSADSVHTFDFGRTRAGTPYTVREYNRRWMALAFTPLGWMEAKARRRVVYLDSLDKSEWECFTP